MALTSYPVIGSSYKDILKPEKGSQFNSLF